VNGGASQEIPTGEKKDWPIETIENGGKKTKSWGCGGNKGA